MATKEKQVAVSTIRSSAAAKMPWMMMTAISGFYLASTVLDRLHSRYLARPLYPAHYQYLLHPLAALFLALPVFIVSHTKLYWLRASRANGCEPAAVYPHKDPIMGFDWMKSVLKASEETRLIEFFLDHFNDIGNTFWFNAGGDWTLMTNEPENVKAILSTQFNVWPIQGLRKTTAVVTLGPKAVFSTNGKEWQHARAVMRPSFVRNQLADLECTDRHVENFLAKLKLDGSKLDLQPLFFLFTMDVSTDFMFGHSTDMLRHPSPEADEFIRCFEYTMISSLTRARMGRFAFLLRDRKLDESIQTSYAFIDQFISSAFANGRSQERPYVFMNELIDSGASHDEIRSQLLSMILGGRDTSASTMSSLFWVLARRPEIFAKMKKELEVLNGEKPTWEQTRELKYLNHVIKEVLRLYPPVISNLRSASQDTILPRGGGKDGQSPLFVPKGTTCRYSIVSMQRRKDLYGEDADAFRPERWETLRTSWEYIPFSGGPRICIGQQFALTQVTYMVARILQTIGSVEAMDDLPMEMIVSATTSLKNGCWVKMTPA